MSTKNTTIQDQFALPGTTKSSCAATHNKRCALGSVSNAMHCRRLESRKVILGLLSYPGSITELTNRPNSTRGFQYVRNSRSCIRKMHRFHPPANQTPQIDPFPRRERPPLGPSLPTFSRPPPGCGCMRPCTPSGLTYHTYTSLYNCSNRYRELCMLHPAHRQGACSKECALHLSGGDTSEHHGHDSDHRIRHVRQSSQDHTSSRSTPNYQTDRLHSLDHSLRTDKN
jgi:hypothetical protein